jgi:hypothetical protein
MQNLQSMDAETKSSAFKAQDVATNNFTLLKGKPTNPA